MFLFLFQIQSSALITYPRQILRGASKNKIINPFIAVTSWVYLTETIVPLTKRISSI